MVAGSTPWVVKRRLSGKAALSDSGVDRPQDGPQNMGGGPGLVAGWPMGSCNLTREPDIVEAAGHNGCDQSL